MGIKNLWQLLSPVGRSVSIETLAGKVRHATYMGNLQECHQRGSIRYRTQLTFPVLRAVSPRRLYVADTDTTPSHCDTDTGRASVHCPPP